MHLHEVFSGQSCFRKKLQKASPYGVRKFQTQLLLDILTPYSSFVRKKNIESITSGRTISSLMSTKTRLNRQFHPK